MSNITMWKQHTSTSSSGLLTSTSRYPPPPLPTTAVGSLHLLSSNLHSILLSDLFADAHLTINSDDTLTIPVHRCLLSAGSPFFRHLFARENRASLHVKDLVGELDIGYEPLVLVLGHVYSGRLSPLPKGSCCCADEDCLHVGCRPAVDFMLQVLYASFVFHIFELVSHFELLLLDALEKVLEDDALPIVYVANLCGDHCKKLLSRSVEKVIHSTIDVVTLEKTLPAEIAKLIVDSRVKMKLGRADGSSFPDKHVKRIYRALDSGDVELVRMLLKERPHSTLDDAYALHYAVSHCDPKITTELLDLGIADVNHKDLRGYTVLHVAAMRRDPKIIVSLITKGARTSETAPDGRKAIQIARQLTKSDDYNRLLEQGMPSSKDRLCIEVLENAERPHPVVGEAADVLVTAGEDLKSKLLYLENRVGLASLLFPEEAKIAMANAKVDDTREFTLTEDVDMLASQHGLRTDDFPCSRSLHTKGVDDLNETPFTINEERLARMRALSRTVELGRRFFPRCSRVLDKITDDGTTDLVSFKNETSVEMWNDEKLQEIREDITKAFNEDKEDLSSCSSSVSVNLMAMDLTGR